MKRQIKDAIYGHLAVLTKALSSPKRIEIIDLLCQGEKTVEVISAQTNLGLKNTSAQLKALRAAHLVDSRKMGTYVFYRIADPSVADFWVRLRKFGHERIAELQKITEEALGGSEILEQMDRRTLLAKAKRGEVVLIDVRPADEFRSGHLPFAVSIPLEEISKHLRKLPKKKTVVAYCRGPYCFFAKEAVETLRKRGFNAFSLKDGVYDWISEGLPIEEKSQAMNSGLKS